MHGHMNVECVKAVSCPVLTSFRKSIAFGKIHRLRSFG